MILGLYDGEGSPQNRLSLTPETDVSGSDGWQTINLVSPVSVRGGQTIWLAWVYQLNPGTAHEEGSPGKVYSPGSWSGGMPEQFGYGYILTEIDSIYATYTPD